MKSQNTMFDWPVLSGDDNPASQFHKCRHKMTCLCVFHMTQSTSLHTFKKTLYTKVSMSRRRLEEPLLFNMLVEQGIFF